MSQFRLYSRNEIDDEKWNQCVLADPHFRHYPLTYFLDAVCQEWCGIICSDYDWVWPLPTKRFPVSRVYQPLLAQQLGPYGRELSAEVWLEVWQWVNQHFRQARIKFNDRYTTLPVPHISHTNVELSLAADYMDIRGRFNRNVRGNLKKAENAELEVKVSSVFDPWILETFKATRGAQISEVNEEFFHHVASVYSNFEKRNEALTYTAILRKEKVAQLSLLTTNNRLLLFFSASNQSGREVGAMHALLNEVIKDHASSSHTFDFEGSDNENLAFFYASFGGEERVYLQAESDRLFWPLNKLLS